MTKVMVYFLLLFYFNNSLSWNNDLISYVGLIFVLLICIIVLGIIFLLKLNKTISNVLEILENNKKNIEYTCDKLPVVSKNMVEITDNIKDISEVATDFTADAIVTKENIINNYDMVKEIFKIIKSVFIK